MKKINHIASRLAMLALAFTTVITLTACGGGDDDLPGIPNNSHSNSVIEGRWVRGNSYYDFESDGTGCFVNKDYPDNTCTIKFNVQGSGNYGTIFIRAVYSNHKYGTTSRDDYSGSYNLKDGYIEFDYFKYYRK